MQEESSTEQRILEAAESVFLEDGFAGARMQHIADRAGINKAMLHYYFRSKDKLFELVFRHKMKQFVPQITAALHDDSLSFLEKMDRFIMAYLSMLMRNQGLPVFVLSTLARNPQLLQFFQLEFGKEVVQIMQEEIKKGNIRAVDPHQFMLTLIGMCIFPFAGRTIFSKIFSLTDAAYQEILRERHVHVMQYIRDLLVVR